MVLHKPRDHQKKAIENIDKYIKSHGKCCVIMFCGSGKSLIMMIIGEKYTFCVFVFPSIALITQFNIKYLKDASDASMMNICSRDEVKKMSNKHTSTFTTDEKVIKQFLKTKHQRKIICVTYQSYNNFFKCCNDVDVHPTITLYDEAHHCSEPKVVEQIKQAKGCKVFFTATPRNTTQFSMKEDGDCGPIAYEYTHRQGVIDKILNDFQVVVDISTDGEDSDILRKIAHAILKTGTKRVLTFHKRVNYTLEDNADQFTKVKEFVTDARARFKTVLDEVCDKHYPKMKGYYTDENIHIDGIYSDSKNKQHILQNMQNADDKTITIISSCQTISEGVDTFNANMSVFADHDNDINNTIQRIGRIVRKQKNISTVLIPVSINKKDLVQSTTYEMRDKVVRKSLCNYGQILDVISYLKQNDPTLIGYSNKLTDSEMESNFNNQGATVRKNVVKWDTLKCKIETNENVKYIIHHPNVDEPTTTYNNNAIKERVYYEKNDGTFRLVKKSRDKRDQTLRPVNKVIPVNYNLSDDLQVMWDLQDPHEINETCARIVCTVKDKKYSKEIKDDLEMVKQVAIVRRICAFVKKYGYQPQRYDNGKTVVVDEEELSVKLSRMRNKLKPNPKAYLDKFIFYEESKKILNEEWPDWQDDTTYRMENAAQNLAEFARKGKATLIESNDSSDQAESSQMGALRGTETDQTCSSDGEENSIITLPSSSDEAKDTSASSSSSDTESIVVVNDKPKRKPKCKHRYTVVREDEDHFHKRCTLCGRESKQSINARTYGYVESNPLMKEDINNHLANINYNEGKAVLLDAIGLKTSNALVNASKFKPENIVIPEYDEETYDTNRKDPRLGTCLVQGDFLTTLKTLDIANVSLIYADFTGHFNKMVRPLLDYIKINQRMIKKGTVLVCTWSTNGDKKNRFIHLQYIGWFIESWDLPHPFGADEAYGYGKGGNMYVEVLVKK
jgi:superfamily II DNA or RNA helicase